MKSYKFIINGKVQGVYYRANVKKNALNADYSGYVKNLPDGTVEAGIMCEDEQLSEFINILKQGSKHSNVTSLKQLDCNEIFNKNFEIRK